MGQKVHPIGFRLGVTKTWSSVWYADRNYAELLHEDLRLREYVKRRLYHAGVAKIDIERAGSKARIYIHTARPGIVIGRHGAEVDTLRAELHAMTGREIKLDIIEVKTPETNAQLVAENLAMQLERRVSFRRAMKRTLTTAMRLGARGIKIRCAGRLAGAEIARVEQYREGRVPCHTLRADIDYGVARAQTTFGVIGVKVWIFREEIMPQAKAGDMLVPAGASEQ
ncbi:MAG: 30S ribosomal protein S3 [Candidatus Hydrogenedentes bacterium]|nr:30S ribosomal protein S3 [Candidatus Hydrogenedentota bacterium]